MQATLTAFDFKSMPDQKFNNLRLPRASFAGVTQKMRDVTLSGAFVEGLVFSYYKENAVFSRTYAGISEEINVAPSTVSEAMKRLKKCGRVQSEEQSSYTYNIDKLPKKFKHGRFGGTKFFVCPEIFYKNAFRIRGEVRMLTKSETLIASAFLTLALDENAPAIKISHNDVGKELGICRQTVVSAVQNLMYAGIISRAAHEVGINGHKKSTYHINGALFRNVKKWLYKKATPESSAPKSDKPTPMPAPVQDAYYRRPNRENWYAERRHDAEERADAFVKRAKEDVEYNEADKQLKALEIKIALRRYAEGELITLKAQLEGVQKRRKRALKRLNLRDVDFIPKYYCQECDDTGWRKSDRKPCDCYDKIMKKIK